jgi:hypothetical protein
MVSKCRLMGNYGMMLGNLTSILHFADTFPFIANTSQCGLHVSNIYEFAMHCNSIVIHYNQ